MFTRGNSEISLVGKDFTADESSSPGGWSEGRCKPAFGGPGETGTDQEVSRRHKTRDKHVRVDVVVVSFSKLGLEGHQSTGIPVFRYFVSIGGRQVDFVVCFSGAVRFGFIQTVVEFQTIVPEVFRLFIVGKVVELQVESYCVITSGSPLAQADLA